jgi:hypothetical protein
MIEALKVWMSQPCDNGTVLVIACVVALVWSGGALHDAKAYARHLFEIHKERDWRD